MVKERIQKKMEPKWNPLNNARRCIELLKEDVEKCDSSGIIAHAGCVYGNAEAAFYEKFVNEDGMESLKESVVDIRKEFKERCSCSKR